MSIRESVASNIISVLQAARLPVKPKYVTRDPFDFDELSNAQFPAILVQTTSESREDATIGNDQIRREGTITYELIGYVKSKTIDSARNALIETIEEALDEDRTRGNFAIDTQITSITTDEGSITPIGGVVVTVNVMYNFIRGNT